MMPISGVRFMLLVGLLGTVLAGCVGGDADPEGERLTALKNDPVLRLEPAGSTIATTSDQAGFDDEIFDFPPSGSSVAQRYRITGKTEDVRDAFQRELPVLGWRFSHLSQPQGQAFATMVYKKKFDHWTATLVLSQHRANDLVLLLKAPPVDSRG